MVLLGCLAALALGAWAFTKYKDTQAERRSEELRNLYASVHAEKAKR
jgi:hypothetical protein